MDTLRSVAHLQRELGDTLFSALTNSDNTKAVLAFASELAVKALPKEIVMRICQRSYSFERCYDNEYFLEKGGIEFVEGKVLVTCDKKVKCIGGNTLVARANEMLAQAGEDDAEYIIKHQHKIPVELRNIVILVFPGWHNRDYPDRLYYIAWRPKKNSWVISFGARNDEPFWHVGANRLVRRIK